MSVVLPGLNFSLVTDNDDMIQIDVVKRSDGLPAAIESAKWEMFAPGTRDAVLVKEGADIIIIAGAVKFLISNTDTEDLTPGIYTHELTIITEDGRIHTVTKGDYDLSPGSVNIREIFTVIS